MSLQSPRVPKLPCLQRNCQPTTGPVLGLLIVFFIVVAIMVLSLQFRSQSLREFWECNPEQAGEGLVIHGNGLGYYAWLRSLLINGDLDFANEFDQHRLPGDFVPPSTYLTPLNRRANQWSVGPAIIWAIAIIPVHFILRSEHTVLPWPADGYSMPYQGGILFVGVLSSLASILMLYRICRHFALPHNAALATGFLVLGTSIAYYASVSFSMAHGLGTTCVAFLVAYWLHVFGSEGRSRWIVTGVLCGLSMLMRWQLGTLLFLPIAEAAVLLIQKRFTLAQSSFRLTLAFCGAAISFFPQMIAWKLVYGHWLVSPVPGVSFHYLSPSFGQVLWGDRGLLYWTPLCVMGLAGVLTPRFRYSTPAIILYLSFVLQIVFLSLVWGKGPFQKDIENYAGVFSAKAFGMRHATESLVTLAPTFAMLLAHLARRGYFCAVSVCAILSIWNLIILYEYSSGHLPDTSGASFWTLILSFWRVASCETIVFLAIVEGVVLFVIVCGGDIGSFANLLESRRSRRKAG